MTREEMIEKLVAKEIQAMDEGIHGFDYFIQKYYGTRSSFELEEEIKELGLEISTQEVEIKEYDVVVEISLTIPIQAESSEEAEKKAISIATPELFEIYDELSFDYKVYLDGEPC